MLKVTYQDSKEWSNVKHTENFNDLSELTDWMFKSAIKNVEGKYEMQFPNKRYRCSANWWMGREKGQRYIRMVENEKGIIFSDGTYTSRQYFISDGFLSWCKDSEELAKNGYIPSYNFVNDNVARNDEGFYKRAFNSFLEGYLKDDRNHSNYDVIDFLSERGFSQKDLISLGFDKQDIKDCKEIRDLISFDDNCEELNYEQSNNDVNLKQNTKEKFENLIYQRGLSDFEWDNHLEQIRWLLEADMNKEELLELGYEEEDVDQELEEVKEELKTNDRER